MPKNDLISGDDFLSILIRGDRNEDLYRDTAIPTRVSRYRRPFESTSNNKESPLPLETLFSPYQDRRKTQYYERREEEKEDDKVDFYESKILSKQNNDLKESTSTENALNVATTDSAVSSSVQTENDTEEILVTTETSSTSVETTTPSMKVITSVQVSSSVEEEVKVHTKRPKAKQLKSEDSMKSDSSHFHTIINAPEIVDDESEFLYSSIPRSRMQRKQDNTSPYQTIIHHDDQGTISFSSLNISPKDSGSPKQRGGSWWWYGWNYPHLSKSSTTTPTQNTDISDDKTTSIIVTTTTDSTTISSTTMPPTNTPTTSSQEEHSTIIIPTSSSYPTSTERIILHDLNKIPYDKLNAPVEESQNNDLHALLGKFVPSNCKQQQQQQEIQQATTDEMKSTDTHFVSLDDDNDEQNDDNENVNNDTTSTDNEFHKDFTEQKTDDAGVGIAEHSYRSTEEEDDAKFGYVVEGRNYRKYRVEEKTSDGYLVGEYGVLSHNDGSLRGVRYTADSNINPRLIHDALMKFLSL